MKRSFKKIVWILIASGLVCGGAGWYFMRGDGNGFSFRTSDVTRGELLVSINATGTVEPEEVVNVGAQVAGQIVSFGTDINGKEVDYGSFVEAGTVLARIDDSLYAADLAQSQAQVESAKANVEKSQADLLQFKAKLTQAELDWNRAKKLGPKDALSQASYDAYQAAYEIAKANVGVGEAAVVQATSSLAEAQAMLSRTRRNLGYCTITSPVKGVIIDRRVNIGQTVVASLNAPSLFLIAKDLTRIQVWVAVNEADIGKIYPGQPVTFTVDAFPGESFRGDVGKIRLNASMTQNVVTYTVEIVTDNSNGRLLPYLTANVQFEVNRLPDVLQVPNAALRWSPSADQVAPAFRDAFKQSDPSAEKPETSTEMPEKNAAPSGKNPDEKQIWILEGKYVRPVRVVAGMTDGIMTQIEGQDVNEKIKVVTGVQAQKDGQADAAASSPFTPKFMRGGRSGGGR